MWYWHQIWSGPFIIGVAGNITAAIIGFIAGLAAAHWLYDLRAIHKAIKEHTSTHRKSLSHRYTKFTRSPEIGGRMTVGQPTERNIRWLPKSPQTTS